MKSTVLGLFFGSLVAFLLTGCVYTRSSIIEDQEQLYALVSQYDSVLNALHRCEQGEGHISDGLKRTVTITFTSPPRTDAFTVDCLTWIGLAGEPNQLLAKESSKVILVSGTSVELYLPHPRRFESELLQLDSIRYVPVETNAKPAEIAAMSWPNQGAPMVLTQCGAGGLGAFRSNYLNIPDDPNRVIQVNCRFDNNRIGEADNRQNGAVLSCVVTP